MTLLIALEGPDGVGTTTQAARLVSALRDEGQPAHLTREPSDGPWGRQVREALKGPPPDERGWRALALGFAADRLDHLAREIEPRLVAGEVVVTDRYLLSSLVYQALHAPAWWVESINRYARPADLVVLLSLDVDEALARVAARRGDDEVYDQRSLQERVHRRYRELAQRRGNVRVVDAGGSVDDVAARVLAVVRERLVEVSS